MKLRVVAAPSGGACRHIHLVDVDTGQVQLAIDRDDPKASIAEADPVLLAQVKQVVRGAKATTPAQVKTAIEAAEF